MESKIDFSNPKFLRSMPPNCTPQDFINFTTKIYKKNNLTKIKKSKNSIPKIIHQIWFGQKIPPNYINWQKTWKQKHPKWKYIFWNEKKLNQYFVAGLFNQKLFNKAKKNENYAQMADIARYEIIHKFGGIYVDCDCQAIKSFDKLVQSYDFFACLEHIENGLVVGNATFGAKPNHPILAQCLQNIKKYETSQKIDLTYWKGSSGYCKQMEKQYALTLTITGPILFTKSIWEMADKENNIDIIFPHTYFFPFPEYKIYKISKTTFSCHYFQGIWKKNLLEKFQKNQGAL
ncbi:hypothetical protein GF322_04215 [Candidatus Dependentiae bacterium]|nr:hypothetical protein [Candidatus Dependentiae bacterium]